MEKIDYVGEHTFIGQFGHTLLIIAFVAALFSSISYFLAVRNEKEVSWRNIGRAFFWLHSLTTLIAIGLMFFMLLNRYFEYDFIWKHSNLTMPMKYIMSCFWEGQEGSFLLWSFWHIVLANILIWTAGKWERPTMAVIALVQAFLATMVLGLYIAGQKWGSSPFILIRELPENLDLP